MCLFFNKHFAAFSLCFDEAALGAISTCRADPSGNDK